MKKKEIELVDLEWMFDLEFKLFRVDEGWCKPVLSSRCAGPMS